MPRLFNFDIAGELNRQMGPLLLPATLIKVSAGARTGGALNAGTAVTTASYAARGFMEDFRRDLIDGTLIRLTDKKVTLLGSSIASLQVPEPDDQVTIEGATFQVIHVQRDPAAATYVLQVR